MTSATGSSNGTGTTSWQPDELMVIAASRALTDDDVCFVGIGPPSAASNLARLTHSPGITLIYESGTLGTTPEILPLSIGDGVLADESVATVSVPEMFAYWLQGGHIAVGFLAAAQMDRYGNLNTTVIGAYDAPTVRLPGGGGAPEIAGGCQEIYVIMPHGPRSLVDELDFVTTLGHGPTGTERQRLGVRTAGPTRVFTDLCIMRAGDDNELQVTSLHPGVGRRDVTEATGWDIRFSAEVGETPPPTDTELEVLRELYRRSDDAHAASGG